MTRLAPLVLACLMLPAFAAAGEARRFGLFIGSNEGVGSDVPLLFAEVDATRARQAFVDVGGFRPEDSVVLASPDADDVVRVAEDLVDRLRRAANGGAETLLLVYYSGHADAQSLHLGATELSLAHLKAVMDSSGAKVRIAILDACRSGGFSRLKGGTAGAPFEVLVEAKLEGEGHVALTSSAADEDSQESDRLGGSYFTHHLVSGLRGAADASADRVITLDELYRYVYRHTVRATRATLAGVQHPGYRYDIRGRGELVIATVPAPSGRVALLRFDVPGSYMVTNERTGEVTAEVRSTRPGARLVVAPGTYRASRREASSLLEVVIDAPAGAETRVREEGMERLAYARLVRKGGADAGVAAHGLLAGAGVQSGIDGIAGGMPVARVGYGLDLRWLSLRGLLTAGQGSGRTPTLSYELRQVSAALQLVHVVDLGPVGLGAGLSAGVVHLRQRLSDDEGERTAIGFGFGGVALASAQIAGPLTLELTGEVGTQTFPFSEEVVSPAEGSHLESALVSRAIASLGWSF